MRVVSSVPSKAAWWVDEWAVTMVVVLVRALAVLLVVVMADPSVS